jgi:hypothetical protein
VQIRNYAMLVLLAVYGFRSGEVCGHSRRHRLGARAHSSAATEAAEGWTVPLGRRGRRGDRALPHARAPALRVACGVCHVAPALSILLGR